MVHIRLIASKNHKEYFANKVKDLAESHLGIELKVCDIHDYWKDSSQVLIEASFSVFKPLFIDIWKELFSQITKDYSISQDNGFVNFEHFENLDTLKSKAFSCFAVLCIPCGLVIENGVPCPKYEFKIEAGQAMPTLKLGDGSMLYTCIPDEPEFVEDEIEIWLDSYGEKICLFKDSLHYVIAVECAWVVEHCEIQADEADICFPKLFFDYCLGKNSDESYLNYQFADYQSNTTWLTKPPSGDMIIEIWEIDPYNDNPICEQKYSFTVSYNDFMIWWNRLLAMDNLRQEQ